MKFQWNIFRAFCYDRSKATKFARWKQWVLLLKCESDLGKVIVLLFQHRNVPKFTVNFHETQLNRGIRFGVCLPIAVRSTRPVGMLNDRRIDFSSPLPPKLIKHNQTNWMDELLQECVNLTKTLIEIKNLKRLNKHSPTKRFSNK